MEQEIRKNSYQTIHSRRKAKANIRKLKPLKALVFQMAETLSKRRSQLVQGTTQNSEALAQSTALGGQKTHY